jgi:hypothetical protein
VTVVFDGPDDLNNLYCKMDTAMSDQKQDGPNFPTQSLGFRGPRDLIAG